ncbi:myosin-2 essential light chain-like [Actinia tenebrosa]|uniref:Myosin-2 essential light chain-like n=1 Tax=Actinia tenebrosa TaxID=6105 RepID=A0A6P8HLU3_ACTTE|nr:myosin-2 essential light chain-like [Actinia tenebrosa]
MATQLSERQVEEITDGFSLYDTVGDGKVDSHLLGEVLRALGQNPTNIEVAKVIKQLDPQGNRRVSIDEFLPVFQSLKAKTRPFGSEDFIDSLKVFDNDGSGMISAGELRHVLTSIGEKLSDEEVDALFQAIEYNQGQVNYEDFIKLVLNS